MQTNTDIVKLMHIIKHCTRVEENLNEYNYSFEEFKNRHIFLDACCMGVFQIGELANSLSTDFKSKYPNVAWDEFRRFRNFYGHAYQTINVKRTWEIICDDVPILKQQCQKILEDNKNN